MFFGMSARSFSLSFGRMMFFTPARCAASTFSLTPPIGSTLPRNVISPVIATSRRTRDARESRHQRRRERDPRRRAVLRDGAFGHVDVHVRLAVEVLRDAELLGLRPHPAERRLRRLLHHVAKLAGERQRALAWHQRGLGHEDLAADLRPGEARGDADLVRLFHLGRTEARYAEVLGDLVGRRPLP